MTIDAWYWVFFVLAILFAGWNELTAPRPYPWPRFGGVLFFFILFFLIGLRVFGSPVK